MVRLDRTNTSFLGRWWWTIDRYIVFTICILLAVGSILVMASSPSVASRIGLPPHYFIYRQMIFIIMALIVIFGMSFISPIAIRRLCIIGFLVCIFFMILVLFMGAEIKGARRWISILGFSFQPSEFMKTFFVVFTGWVLSKKISQSGYKSFITAGILYCVFAFLLILQPDFGTTVTVTLIWTAQMFLAGLSWVLLVVAAILFILGIFLAYVFLPHVTARINKFFDPESSDTYQVTKSIQAFLNGGIFGKGPGQGVVKEKLPDSHTDFVFAVAGEELGMIVCMVIIALFAFLVIRGITRVIKEDDPFIILAVSGLLMQIGLQSLINMSVSLHLIPTKGMTLPFISYGGSSMLSAALAMGIILSLTRKRFGVKNNN